MIATTTDGQVIFYDVTGAGVDVLVIHGAASDSDTMLPLVSELSRKHRTIAVDRLGYGRSSHLTRDTTLEEQAGAIESVRQVAAPGPVWLCGHSSGGNVAAGYATLFPENVLGLILIEPPMYSLYPAASAPPELRRMREEIAPLFASGRIAEGIRLFTKHLEVAPETWTALEQSGHGKNAAEKWPPLRYEFKFALEWPRTSSDLKAIFQPVLILEGENTTELLRGAGRLLAEAVDHAQLTILPGSDHLAPIVKPQLVAGEVTGFIEAHRPAD